MCMLCAWRITYAMSGKKKPLALDSGEDTVTSGMEVIKRMREEADEWDGETDFSFFLSFGDVLDLLDAIDALSGKR